MTNRNNTWNTPEAWANTPFNAWTTGTNPFTTWNVTPFASAPLNTAMTAFASATPNTPSANAYENSESYTFEIAAPGYATDSFELSYAYPTLTLRATAPKSDRPNYSYREFNYGSFTREFTLPNNADATEAKAKYENGILTVMVPKTAATNYRTIKIS